MTANKELTIPFSIEYLDIDMTLFIKIIEQ